MKAYRVAIMGSTDFAPNSVESEALRTLIYPILEKHEFVEFYFGNDYCFLLKAILVLEGARENAKKTNFQIYHFL